MNRNPKHRLGAHRDAAELKEHPFFKTIDWEALSGRVSQLRRHLQAIVDDVDEEFASEAHRTRASGSRRPRKENEFWMEAVKNVRQQGSRRTAGVRGQFLHFNKTQPG